MKGSAMRDQNTNRNSGPQSHAAEVSAIVLLLAAAASAPLQLAWLTGALGLAGLVACWSLYAHLVPEPR